MKFQLHSRFDDDQDELPENDPQYFDPLDIAEKEEEHYLQHDSAAKFQFSYNRTTVFADDHPEVIAEKRINEPISIAPGEGMCVPQFILESIVIISFSGKLPISLLQDPNWDIKSHPHLDPTSKNGMNQERKVKLSNVAYIDQRLKNCNPVFSQCSSLLYAYLSYIENKQMSNACNISVQRGYKKKNADGSSLYHLEDAYSVFDNVSNTPR